MRSHLATAALVLLVLPLSGCLSDDPPRGSEEDLRFDVQLSTASMQPGQSVTIRVILTSVSPASVQVTFNTSKTADVLITNPATLDHPFSSSEGRNYAQVRTSVDVPEFSSTVLLEVAWDGRYTNGTDAPPGEYRVVAQAADHPQWVAQKMLSIQ